MVVRLLALVVLLILIAAPAAADATFPDRPGERDFIADAAGLIDADDAREIVEVADALLTDRKIPIIVVTIDSMAAYRARGWPIEAYARDLFDRYGIGFQDWNYGMLLLVSVGDRKARIELGGAWAGRKNRQSKRLMDKVIVPMFKRGQYSEGILLGVQGLDAIARGARLPSVPRPRSFYMYWALGIGLAIFTIVSLIRSGSRGWAWLLWSVVFMTVFVILKVLAEAEGSGGSGSWGGGSFGGGSGGGGGATGSW